MNFKGTKKLYIIKTWEQILYFNSIKHKHSVSIQLRRVGIGGWGSTPQKSVQIHPAVCFLPCQILTKLCDFHYPISGLIQSSIPNFKPCRSYTPVSKLDESSHPRKCFWVVCYSKCTLITGDLLKHTVYIQCIYHSTYISLCQIRNYSYIAYGNLF